MTGSRQRFWKISGQFFDDLRQYHSRRETLAQRARSFPQYFGVSKLANPTPHPTDPCGSLSYCQVTPLRQPTLNQKIHQFSDSGVVLLIGTDGGLPMNFHSQINWRELDTWVTEFKIDPLTAIRAATYWPSVMMKVSDQVGTVNEGKYADIIAVRADVLRHINLLQNVDIVIKHCRRYK
jgi:hypothetical protein